jgi:hypothetical protein
VTAASVLLEPKIPYDYLIQVMDVVRSAEVEQPIVADNGEQTQAADPSQPAPHFVRVALFTNISIGEAP